MPEIMLRIVPDVQSGDGSRTPVRGIAAPTTSATDGKTIGIINNLDKSISDLSRQIRKSTDKNEIKQLSEQKRGLEKEKSGMTSPGLIGGLGGMSGIASMVFGIGALVEIAKALFDVFKPVQSLIQAILKTLGMFLQPIAEVLVIMLRPILDLLRPVLMIFRAMLMPVMQQIRQLGTIMSSQVAEGDMPGAMATGALMSGLFAGAMFIGLANMIGKVIIDGIASVLKFAVDVIFFPLELILTPISGLIKSIFGIDLIGGLQTLKDNLKQGITDGATAAKAALDAGTQTMMKGMVDASQIYIDANVPDFTAWEGAVKPFETVATDSIAAVSDPDKGLPKITSEFGKTMADILALIPKQETQKNKKIPKEFGRSLDSLNDSKPEISEMKNKGGAIKNSKTIETDNAWYTYNPTDGWTTFAKTVSEDTSKLSLSVKNLPEIFSTGVSKLNEFGDTIAGGAAPSLLTNLKTAKDKVIETFSLTLEDSIPKKMESGMNYMVDINTKYVGATKAAADAISSSVSKINSSISRLKNTSSIKT